MSNFMHELAIKARDKSKNNGIAYYDKVYNLEELISEFLQCDVYFPNSVESARLKSYSIAQWYCTDSYVGFCGIFLDDNLIAITHQAGRKCDIDYYFISNELAKEFLNFLKELRDEFEEEKNLLNNMEILNLEEFKSFKDGYFQVQYYSQILTSIYKNVYIKENDIYIKCDSFKPNPLSERYSCKGIIVTFNEEDHLKAMDEVYFKCSD